MVRTPSPARAGRQEQLRRRAPLFLACAVLFTGSGCLSFHRKAPAYPWATAAQRRPRVPERLAAPAAEESVPDLQPALPPASPYFATPQSAPPRPRTPAAPGAESDPAGRVEAPQIAPQLTSEEFAAAQQQVSKSVRIAERNLERTRGRSLTPMQADLAEKVRGFISQAREAARHTDWVRARNLAEKAQFLSEDLIRSM